LFEWKKLGRVFDPKEFNHLSWLSEFAQAPCVLKFDDFVRVYFSCRPPADVFGRYVSRSAFVDLNRANLFEIIRLSERPVLELGDKGTFDEFGTYPISVIRDGNIVRAYYAGWTRCESVPFNVAIGVAESYDDGVTFQKLGNGPVIPYTPDEPFVMSGPKIRRLGGEWVLFYIAGRKWIIHENRPEPVYKIRMARSRDGISWIKHGHDLIKSHLEFDEAQASPDVFYANDRYHMFFCFRRSRDYRCKDGGYRIGYASSTDLVNWTRNDALAGINVSEAGWDSEMVSYPHVFELDGQTFMFYLGNSVGRHGFGVARLDGAF
jgi:hypothetical protein